MTTMQVMSPSLPNAAITPYAYSGDTFAMDVDMDLDLGTADADDDVATVRFCRPDQEEPTRPDIARLDF